MLHVNYIKEMSCQPTSKLGLATGGTMTEVYKYLVELLERIN